MDEDPTEEMIKAEIKAAAQILRDDGILKHSKETSERLSKLEARFGGDTEGEPQDDKTPPPAKDKPAPPAPKRKGGVWWGPGETDTN